MQNGEQHASRKTQGINQQAEASQLQQPAADGDK